MSEEFKAELNYLVREVQFAGGHRYLAYHSGNITSKRISYDALLPLSNLLLLRHKGLPSPKYFTASNDGKKCINTTNLVWFVHDKLKDALKFKIKSNEISRKDADDFLSKSDESIRQLSYNLGVYPIVESITSLKVLDESLHSKLFELLDVDIYFGLLPDPEKDEATFKVVHGEFLKDLTKLFRTLDLDRPDEMELIKNFIVNKIGLTQYGFDCLQRHVPENSLSILWRNSITFVIFKHKGGIYELKSEENDFGIMWLEIKDAHGKLDVLSSNFTPATLPSDELIEEEEKTKREKEKKQRKKERKRNKNLTGKGDAIAFEDVEGDAIGFEDVKESSQSDLPSTHHSVDVDAISFEDVKESRVTDVLSCVYTFRQFCEKNIMYTVYKYDDQDFESTSHIGRRMGKGYLDLILRKHKVMLSWNGDFTENNMYVKTIGDEMHFEINLPAQHSFSKDCGVKDFEKYLEIMAPHYKSHPAAELPHYLDKFQSDFMQLPSPDLNQDAFNKFQKFLGNHMCWKAPLVRSALISNLYRVCKSLMPDGSSAYAPLFCTEKTRDWTDTINNFCEPLDKVYSHGHTLPGYSRYNNHTFWCFLWLGRNAIEHLCDNSKVDGVQLITDVVLSDLILEHDLKGHLSDVVRKVMNLNNFDGEFASIWRHFEASESFDELNSPPATAAPNVDH